MLRSVLTSEAHGGSHDTLPAEERSMSAAGLLNRLASLFHSVPFRSLLEAIRFCQHPSPLLVRIGRRVFKWAPVRGNFSAEPFTVCAVITRADTGTSQRSIADG